MNRETDIVLKEKANIKELQDKIDNPKKHNIYNFMMRLLIKSGIMLDYALPFIMSALIIANIQISKGSIPFKINSVKEKAKIETMDTSQGVHIEHISYDFNYEEKKIEYTTGWVINEQGLYERTVSMYEINPEIDITNPKKVLSMSNEELKQLFKLKDTKNIKKNKLNEEDKLYDTDTIIITNNYESNDIRIRQETSTENLCNTLIYLVISLCWGNTIRSIKKIVTKTYVKDKLVTLKLRYKPIGKKEISELKKILVINQNNLELLTSNEEKCEHYHHLRRR